MRIIEDEKVTSELRFYLKVDKKALLKTITDLKFAMVGKFRQNASRFFCSTCGNIKDKLQEAFKGLLCSE